jgi:hypothetical protein
MGPRGVEESWAEWHARMSARAGHGQRQVAFEAVLGALETPGPVIAWLESYAPDAAIASLHTPTNTILAEYLWATLNVFAMSADSIVTDAGVIEWAALPAWVRCLNHVEARRMEAVPKDKQTWTAREVLSMVREAIASAEALDGSQSASS